MEAFARTGEAIRATSSKLEKTRLLGEYFAGLDDTTLPLAGVYFAARPFADRDQRKLNLGYAVIRNAVCEIAQVEAYSFRDIDALAIIAAAGALLGYAALTGSARHREAAAAALGVLAPIASRFPRAAGAGQPARPARAPRAPVIASILRATGRDLLAEVRRLLSDDERYLADQRGLEAMEALLQHMSKTNNNMEFLATLNKSIL